MYQSKEEYLTNNNLCTILKFNINFIDILLQLLPTWALKTNSLGLPRQTVTYSAGCQSTNCVSKFRTVKIFSEA